MVTIRTGAEEIGMNEAPSDDTGQARLSPAIRLLQWLVIGLTASLIVGLITIVAVIVIRFPKPGVREVPLPAEITLPEGTKAHAITYGAGWYAVVTDTDQILIFSAATGKLRQTVTMTAD